MNVFYQNGKAFAFSTLLLLMICWGNPAISQTTLTTTFPENNGFSLVTFNFTNNNASAVIITDIASMPGSSGSMNVVAFYKPSAINGLPGAIDPTNGWNQFGSATITAVASVTQPFMSGLSLIVPAGATYGIAVQADDLSYSTLAAGNYTTVGGGAVLTTGTNIGYGGDVAPNAPTFTPRGFIGSITFAGATACTGTPAPGNTVSSVNPVCPGVSFSLSTQNPTPGSGVIYQWQSSPDGSSWTNIGGANNSTYSTTQTVSTWYRANVTCTGITTASTGLQVTMNGPSSCYCAAGSPDMTFEKISNVQFGTINNASTSTAGYENFTSLSTDMERQNPSPITVTLSGGFNTDQVIVFIDYNHNGSFADPGETAYTSTLGVGPHTGTITIPASALLGPTRMRVRMHDSSLGPNATSCGNSNYGQVEDYTVNIIPCTMGSISAQPASVTTNCSGTATFRVTAAGTALRYQWQERLNATSPWTIVSNGSIYSGATTATLTLTDVPASMNGRQYQVAVGGGCTPQFLSSVVTLTVGPLVASVTPASATVCNGTAQALFISSTAPPSTQTFSSPTLNTTITDNSLAGINNTIAVNAIPAGAIITGIKVKFNITHTWPGDLVMVLKAPNGNILNLDYYISATGAGPGTGFTNTIISSQTTPALPQLGSSSSPYTGSFAPDAVVTPAAGNPPAGPTGYLPNVNNYPALYSTANGNWTFAVADAFSQDEGKLVSWSIDITYGAPFSGVWSPAAGLYTDAAATIPYVAGSQVNTVYTMPTSSTDYTVTINTATCGSASTTVPVTLATAIDPTTISGPDDQEACTDGSVSFTATAGTGNPLAYQWQESVDGGGTWNNIANGGIYSGATSSILTLSPVPVSYSTYQYRALLSVNACTSNAITRAASLTVNPVPDVQIAAGPYTEIQPGTSTTITAAVSPNLPATYQWFLDGLPVAGATDASIPVNIDQLGTYSVNVVDVKGCSSSSGNISISSKASDIAFIYPNPNNGQFQVRYYSAPGNSVVRGINIYDAKGSRVFSKTYNNTVPYNKMDVNMRPFGKGVFRVELSDRSGRRLKTGSVIIL